MDSFITMRAMVEEMYREFKKGQGESTSTPEQGKGIEEPLLVAHLEGKGKGEEPCCGGKSPLRTEAIPTSPDRV